jgi:hypothetical protein
MAKHRGDWPSLPITFGALVFAFRIPIVSLCDPLQIAPGPSLRSAHAERNGVLDRHALSRARRNEVMTGDQRDRSHTTA